MLTVEEMAMLEQICGGEVHEMVREGVEAYKFYLNRLGIMKYTPEGLVLAALQAGLHNIAPPPVSLVEEEKEELAPPRENRPATDLANV